ncbi:class I SAM-dependent methyltransferase [Lihuaxuella thermophila]|uniref:Methyltransferase domain-containing protein n=1 Tax=Lihuaxuella thermophila TaxID=1173111 RepID=A0A1H8DDA8_9BACL|nr:class I SAM-dependent methyltransferase [Lihuaxuella thermophila]SEN04764.1 Methyltransferase domain-containing protein [Lihuaxuella thermophila]
MNIVDYNSKAWDRNVEKKNRWTIPVDREAIQKAKNGKWEIYVTPTKPVPKEWFPPLKGLKVLCLASGGGQQGPVLAAAGAEVTVFDNSVEQLKQDRFVAEREGLVIRTVKGDMRDLRIFDNETFDLIIHPVSNLFVDDVLPVWKESSRVLKKGGSLISGFMNPVFYLFDWELEEQGKLEVRYPIPYSDLAHLTEKQIEHQLNHCIPLEFGHSLEDQIKGQIESGFVITGFYEDDFGGKRLLDKYIHTFIATKAFKPFHTTFAAPGDSLKKEV